MKPVISTTCLTLLLLLTIGLLLMPTAQAQNYAVIHSFTGGEDGASPESGVIIDGGGNLYGTANAGGAYGLGTVYKMSKRGDWILSPLHSFAGSQNGDGANPAAIVRESSGVLYGTTLYGGGSGCGYGCGTVFELRPGATRPSSIISPWPDSLLHSFSGPDGAGPYSLVSDGAGDLFGVTAYGGANGDGAVFELTPSGSGWMENTIYSFTGGRDGANPFGVVAIDALGNVYGTAYQGGQGGYGTVFELTPSGSGWTETTLYAFAGLFGQAVLPQSGLILGPSGSLYGAAEYYGNPYAVVFELSPSNGGWSYQQIAVLYDCCVYANLTMDSGGNLYGTVFGEFGVLLFGSVFKLTPSSEGWQYYSLYQFQGPPDGAGPVSAVSMDANGNLFGTTYYGGSSTECYQGCGVVWEITP